jgi:hypothetical protein
MEGELMVSALVVSAIFTSLSATAAATIAAIATFAISFAASFALTKLMAVKPPALDSASYSQLVQEDVVAQRVIYGRRQVSMVLSFLHEQDGSQTDGEILYMAGMITNHANESISEFYMDEELASALPTLTQSTNPVTGKIKTSGVLRYAFVNGTGVIPEWLLEGAENFTEDMKGGPGCWLAIQIRFNSDYFTSLPTPTMVVEGRNEIYDFRDGTYKYTNNAALVIADFYINYMKVDVSRLMK